MSITRERLLEIIVTGPEASGAEQNELARMALAAMDSESECLPLDYLQGHKDGLEWAAQLAEANHPETGDWLYDDPIELAKAIRKGPDMPPAQPVADSDPVIIVGDDGGDALSYRRLIQSFEPGTKLYRHAQPALVQPVMFIDGDISSEDADKLAKIIREFNEEDERPLAKMARIIRENPHPTNECDMPKAQPAPVVPVVPVVPDDVLDALRKVARIRLDLNDFDGDRRGIVDCLSDAEEALIEVVNSRAAMLAAAPQEVKGE